MTHILKYITNCGSFVPQTPYNIQSVLEIGNHSQMLDYHFLTNIFLEYQTSLQIFKYRSCRSKGKTKILNSKKKFNLKQI